MSSSPTRESAGTSQFTHVDKQDFQLVMGDSVWGRITELLNNEFQLLKSFRAALLVPGSTRGSLPRVLMGVLKSELSLSELPPTMLPNENDGTGEETGNETSHKKSHALAGRCGSAEVNSSGFSNRWNNDFPNNCRSSYPGTGTFWFKTSCNREVALGKQNPCAAAGCSSRHTEGSGELRTRMSFPPTAKGFHLSTGGCFPS